LTATPARPDRSTLSPAGAAPADREKFGSRSVALLVKLLTRIGTRPRHAAKRPGEVRHRFGRGLAGAGRADLPLRFFNFSAPVAGVARTLNPLVVGSIPTRPTNKNLGLASARPLFFQRTEPGTALLAACGPMNPPGIVVRQGGRGGSRT
jgi:hypothetical protein